MAKIRSISLSVIDFSNSALQLARGSSPGVSKLFTYGAIGLISIQDRAERLHQALSFFFETVNERRSVEDSASVYGTIKKVMKDKGFGFIVPDDGSDDIFFHRSRLSPKVYFEDLREGTEVQFEVRPGEKGRQAFNVRLR